MAIIGAMRVMQRVLNGGLSAVPILVLVCSAATLHAGERALVAVASNFTSTARSLQTAFEQQSGHTLTLTFGSTGQLYAQILQGAPYDVFLAADQERPARLEAAQRIVPGSRITYAVGTLVLAASNPPDAQMDALVRLTSGDYQRLAIANPELAPYGRAARETLMNLQAFDVTTGKLVLGENVGQVFAMLNTGNVDLAFIARAQLAQVADPPWYWPVPTSLHTPIRQDLVLLRRARDNPAAAAFIHFLTSDHAAQIIAGQGYRADVD